MFSLDSPLVVLMFTLSAGWVIATSVPMLANRHSRPLVSVCHVSSLDDKQWSLYGPTPFDNTWQIVEETCRIDRFVGFDAIYKCESQVILQTSHEIHAKRTCITLSVVTR